MIDSKITRKLLLMGELSHAYADGVKLKILSWFEVDDTVILKLKTTKNWQNKQHSAHDFIYRGIGEV